MKLAPVPFGLAFVLVLGCLAEASAQNVRVVDGIVVVEDTGTLIASDRQFALPPGTAFLLTPNTKNSFDSTSTAFSYDSNIGRRVVDRLDAVDWVEVDLPFEFPFGGRSFRRVRVSKRGCIAFDAGQTAPIFHFGELDQFRVIAKVERQYRAFDAMADATPRLCPLFTTPIHSTPHRFTSVYFNQGTDRVWFSWEGKGEAPSSFGDISFQLTLNRSGQATFAYRQVAGVQYGAIMAITGREPWWTDERALVRSTQLVQVPHGEFRDFELYQREDSNVLVAKLRFADVLPTTSPVVASYSVELFGSGLNRLGRTTVTSGPQGWSQRLESVSDIGVVPEILGIIPVSDTLSLVLPLDLWVGAAQGFTIRLNLAGAVVQVRDAVRFTAAPREIETDFRTGSRDGGAPIFDVYTVPVIARDRLLQLLRTQVVGAWDHAFIYPSFDHGDGGYSTGDNSAVSGIGRPNTSGTPASGFSVNSYIPADVATYRMCGYLLHGFGHRWLYRVQIVENGVISYAQNRDSSHPTYYVHAPAAFPVNFPREWSTMGGHHWQEEGNGRFSSVPGGQILTPDCGYSWVDLYLMGLAAPTEVPPWFYIRDPQSIPGTRFYSGTKVPVRIEQIIEAMGPRIPSVENSPKEFTIPFVFLHRAGERMAPDQLQRLQSIRDRFVRTFETAVGRRARIHAAVAVLSNTPRTQPSVAVPDNSQESQPIR